MHGLRSTSLTAPVAQQAARRSGGRAGVVLVEANKKAQVVVTRSIALGGKMLAEGELASVRVGFFRNYLAPQGLARLADEEVLAAVRAKKEAEEAAARKLLDEASALATALATIGKFTVKTKANPEDKRIFGAVTQQDVVDAVKMQTNRELTKTAITLPEIKTLGSYEVSVKLHPQVTATFTLVVAKL